MKLYIGHSSNFDYINELYNRLRQSELATFAEITFPHDENGRLFNSKEDLKRMDYVVAEVSRPSTGLGIELGYANLYNIPIIAVYKKGSTVSASTQSVAQYKIEYTSVEDMVSQIKKIIFDEHIAA